MLNRPERVDHDWKAREVGAGGTALRSRNWNYAPLSRKRARGWGRGHFFAGARQIAAHLPNRCRVALVVSSAGASFHGHKIQATKACWTIHAICRSFGTVPLNGLRTGAQRRAPVRAESAYATNPIVRRDGAPTSLLRATSAVVMSRRPSRAARPQAAANCTRIARGENPARCCATDEGSSGAMAWPQGLPTTRRGIFRPLGKCLEILEEQLRVEQGSQTDRRCSKQSRIVALATPQCL